MAHTNPSPAQLRDLLTRASTIAIVGASSKPGRPSHGVMRRMQAAGYRVIPVNPGEAEVHGEKAYPSLSSVPEAVDIVDVFRRASETPAVAEQAVAIGARALWLQAGIWNEDAAVLAKAGGLTVIMDECIAVQVAVLRVQH